MEFINFRGALMSVDDEGARQYSDRGPIWIRKDAVLGFYSHTLLTQNNKIRVMESLEEIAEKFGIEAKEQ